MGNEGQQPPQSGQGSPGQQGYYGWQYDQGSAEDVAQQSPVLPPSPRPYQPQQHSSQPPPSRRGGQQPKLPVDYQEPLPDMGSSLSWGGGVEYQYFDTPQPSQPMPQLRLERLQQLREERMRRQQRRMKSDITTYIPWGNKGAKLPPGGGLPPAAVPPRDLVSGRVHTPPVSPSNLPPSVVARGRSGKLSTTPTQGTAGIEANLQPAATVPTHDTTVLQRVRIRNATLILTFAFIASRILGLLRTSMFAFVFGTTEISDAYLQAFLIPDLIFNVVAGGALSSAFIPVFTNYMVKEKDEKSAWHVASSALNLAVAAMMIFAFVVILLADVLVPLYNPGINDPQRLSLIASLTRIMLLQAIALGAGVIVTAVLNARQDFRSPAIGTVLYNVGLIGGLVPGMIFAFSGNRDDTLAVYYATWGVVAGALLQVAFQIPGLAKVGMHYSFKAFEWRHPGVRQIARQMLPRIINSSVLYTSVFVDRSLIQLMVVVVGVAAIDGLITQYYQSLQLVLLPIGIFGMAVSTATFPTLAENVAKGRMDRVRNTIAETLRGILFMSIPSSVGLIVLGFPIIQVLLQHGGYGLDDALSTAVPLAFFAIGLTGLAAVEILTRSFYALRDSITPVVISIGQFVFKIALSLLLINIAVVWGASWGLGALAFATSVAGLLEAITMFWLLHQRVGGFPLKDLGLFTGRILLAALAMGVALYITRITLDWILGIIATIPAFAWADTLKVPSLGVAGTLVALVKLLIEMFVGVFVYIRGARMLGVEELGPIRRVLDRLKLSWI